MITATVSAQILIRITGLLQIVLGIIFWTGNARELIPLHIIVGIVLVIALWTITLFAALAGVSLWQVALAAVWGFVTLGLGYSQAALLPGAPHWLVQVLHFATGIIAIGLAETLAVQTRRAIMRPA